MPTDEIVLRQALPTDASGIIAHVQEIIAEGVSFGLDALPHGTEDEAAWISTLKPTESRYQVLVHQGRVIGVILVARLPRPSAHVAHLSMSVSKAYRRRGLGARLLQDAIRWGQDQSLFKLSLSVLATNLPAIALYEKHGFVTEGLRRDMFLLAGNLYDEALMSKNL